MTLIVPNHYYVERIKLRGFEFVAGVDEVGRGALAGPVVVAAVILDQNILIDGVKDSKLLSPKKRRELAKKIQQLAVSIGVGWSSAAEIDALGISGAQQIAAIRAIKSLSIPVKALHLDGTHNYIGDGYDVTMLSKGDNLCASIASASIMAKVYRDNYMKLYESSYPDFDFINNVGYGTQKHLDALKHNRSPLHRLSFRSVINETGPL
ncbi:MAG: ribonuclease HII [Candidatus Saccharimonadia bacterium]